MAAITVPAGDTASLSSITLTSCNADSFGYILSTGFAETILTKPAGCATVTAPNRALGPFFGDASLRFFLNDSTCFFSFLSDGLHGALSGSDPFTVGIADGGSGCSVSPGMQAAGGSLSLTVLVAAPDLDLAMSGIPSAIVTDATSPQGATVDYAPPAAIDEGSESPPVSCTPAPKSTFPIGTTTVTCTATDGDDTNGPVRGSFTVHVKGADEQLADLLASVQGVGPGRSLAAKLTDPPDPCSALSDFSNEVSAQSGKKISSTKAASLLADAGRIEAVLGCTAVQRVDGRQGPASRRRSLPCSACRQPRRKSHPVKRRRSAPGAPCSRACRAPRS
jgi:hypothetical protein